MLCRQQNKQGVNTCLWGGDDGCCDEAERNRRGGDAYEAEVRIKQGMVGERGPEAMEG